MVELTAHRPTVTTGPLAGRERVEEGGAAVGDVIGPVQAVPPAPPVAAATGSGCQPAGGWPDGGAGGTGTGRGPAAARSPRQLAPPAGGGGTACEGWGGGGCEAGCDGASAGGADAAAAGCATGSHVARPGGSAWRRPRRGGRRCRGRRRARARPPSISGVDAEAGVALAHVDVVVGERPPRRRPRRPRTAPAGR